MGLLADPQLRAVSLFHPLAPQDYQGPRLGGGLFLSQKGLAPFREAFLFHDESDELRRRLGAFPFRGRTQILTRGADPFAVTRAALAALTSHWRGCDTRVAALETWLEEQQSALLARAPFRGETHFFLGPIRGGRLPELLVIHDGAIGWWVRHGKVRTLNSRLPYVRWGSKWLAAVGEGKLVGLDGGAPPGSWRVEAIGPAGRYNISDPAALAPGIFQVEFMRRLAATDW